MTRPTLLLLALVALAVLAAPAPGRAEPSGGPQVAIRVYFGSRAERDRLLAALNTPDHAVHPEGYLIAFGDQSTLDRLRAQGYHAEVDQAWMREADRPIAELFKQGYRTVEEIYADLSATAAKYPGLAEIVDAGDSWCKTQGGCQLPFGQAIAGYDIPAIHITNRAIAGPKPVAFWVAAHHARELHTAEIALRYIHWLLDNYGADADATWLVDYQDIWVIPMGNPDAHKLVEGPLPWQRKNLNVLNSADWTTCGWYVNGGSQPGIDLNRNHDFHWRGPNGGWDFAPCYQTYPGALENGPASEPEVQGYTALARSLLADQRGPGDEDAAPITTTGVFVSLHSGAEMLLFPYDWRLEPAPNAADLQAVWGKVATWTPGWPACQTYSCLYPAAGTASDWAYGTLGVPAAVWEIGDFMPPYDQVDGYYWPFLRPMMLYTTRIARAPYLEARGPDVNDARALPRLIPVGWPAMLVGTVDDRQNGNQPIAAAELYLDRPPWDGGTPIPMLPADGAFDSPTEEVYATPDLCSLSEQRHIVYMRGQDAGGDWGPVFAAFAGPCTRVPPVFVPTSLR